jgi:NitT/TauT family transport system ATP-binding protein
MSEHPRVIRFADVEQTFGRADGGAVTALDGITFDIGRNEFLAVLGPSGCGKSTLLRLIAGLMFPTRGTISIYDLAVTEPRDEIGIVFQSPTLLPWFDVLGNVTFPLRHKYGRVSADDNARALGLLELVGLTDFARKRIDDHQAACSSASRLHGRCCRSGHFVDDELPAPDALTRDRASSLAHLVRAPKTVLFITHSIPEAVLLADRIIVMTPRPGRVREVIDVDLPRPRSMATLSDPTFHALANHIRGQLFSRAVA